MFSRKSSWILAAAASLAVGNIAFADQPAADRADASPAANQSSRSDATDRNAQSERQTDDQINHLLAQIAQDPKTAADKLFILTAAIHNQAEIELARAVLQKSQNEQVRKMAQRMIQELQKTHDQLQQTAQAVGLQLPQTLGQAAVQEVHIVAALPADQLDRQYTAHVQADNAQDASEYQSESQIAQDPQVKRFADDQLRGARQRTRETNEVAQGMGMQGGDEAQPASGNIPAKGGENR
jgi:predicted outer membrane protein